MHWNRQQSRTCGKGILGIIAVLMFPHFRLYQMWDLSFRPIKHILLYQKKKSIIMMEKIKKIPLGTFGDDIQIDFEF